MSKIKNGFLILSWALYDLANQFFALNVVSLYFVRWLTLEKQKPEILYSIVFGISTFFVAIFAPILGAISDKIVRRRPFLVFFTLLSVIFTMFLGVDNIFLALLFFGIANFGCQTAIVFYNALMVNIAPKDKIGLISGIGKMFGYTGAILALYLIKPIVLKSGYQATFLPTGISFLIFSLPCLIFIKDKHSPGKINPVRNTKPTEIQNKISNGVNLVYFLNKKQILETFNSLRMTVFNTYESAGLRDFLKAIFFGLCAVNAIILFMSVYATQVFGLNEVQIINLIAFSTIFAIAGSVFSGFIGDYIGQKRSLVVVFILWIICFSGGTFARSISLYWLIGALVGMTLGSTWVVSRALAISLVATEKIGEVFGLFNLVGYFSGVIGALFWGLILYLLHPLGQWAYRIALFSLNFFMVLGLIFLLRIPNNVLSKKSGLQ